MGNINPQYYNYVSPGIYQQAMMPSPCPGYNYPSNYQVPQPYCAQHPQAFQFQQLQYDSRSGRYYPIMSNEEGKSKAEQVDAGSPSSEGGANAQYYCFYEPCASQSKFFKRKADLQRHIDAIHQKATAQLIDCEQPNCHRKGGYGFGRRDKMIEHMREVHKVNIPKRGESSR